MITAAGPVPVDWGHRSAGTSRTGSVDDGIVDNYVLLPNVTSPPEHLAFYWLRWDLQDKPSPTSEDPSTKNRTGPVGQNFPLTWAARGQGR